MSTLSDGFVAEFAGILTKVLLHFVWQGAVLALALIGLVKLFDVKSASSRYLFSVGTLFLMGVAPFFNSYLCLNHKSMPKESAVVASDHSGSNIDAGTETVNVEQGESIAVDKVEQIQPSVAVPQWHRNVEFYVLILWLAGVVILSTRLAIGFGVSVWIRANLKPFSDQFEQRILILGKRLKIDARNRVFASMRVGQAIAVGFIRPIVLIPAAWLTLLTPEMLEAVIAHELAHIRRWDLWVNLVQRVIETLLFYHPAVWWLSNRIRLEREMCCDDVAAGCFDRVMYAQSLESVARIAHGNMLIAASISGGKKMNLLSRIRYVLRASPSDTSGNWWEVGFVGMALTFAMAVTFSLFAASTPSVAKADDELEQTKVAEKIQLLGADVTRDDTSPDHPVVSIVIDRNHRFSQKYVPLLKVFKQLTSLSFWNVEITDESLKDLKDLKNLEVLEIGYHNAPSNSIGPIRSRITDVGLKELKGLTRLKKLYLHSADITDEGLKQLSELKDLAELTISATKITDSGLKELRVLKNLTSLDVGRNQTNGITDLGLKELGQLNGLTNLNLSATRITDAGLKELRELKNLQSLDLSFNKITGTGLGELSGLTNLSDLNFVHCLVSDAGLKEIGKLKSPKSLRLSFCQITDTGLKDLSELKDLKELVLRKTQVTDKGIKELKEALPNVQISHDEPLPHFVGAGSVDDTDEAKAIERIKALGGKVSRDEQSPGRPVVEVGFRKFQKIDVDDLHLIRTFPSIKSLNLEMTEITDSDLKELRELKHLTTLNLAQNPITSVGMKEISQLERLTTLSLSNCGRITDDALNEIGNLTRLETLDLGNLPITNDGLKQIGRLTNLISLNLCASKITGAGLAQLKDMKHLTSLELNGVKLTDTDIKEIANLKQITSLNLGVTKITGVGLKELASLQNLTSLRLFNTLISDVDLIALGEFKNLKALDLRSTQITDTGLAELGKLKQLTSLSLAGNRITDNGLKGLSELNNLTELNVATTHIADESMKVIGRFTNLTTLDLSSTDITDVGMREIKNLPNLTSLFVGYTQITDDSVLEISELRNLKMLFLDRIGKRSGGQATLTDEGLKRIGELKHLTNLGLSHTQITDISMKEIGRLENLIRLDLINTPVTDNGLKELRELKNLTTIAYSDVVIDGEAKDLITDAGKKELEAKLPMLNIVRINLTRPNVRR